jgi:sodium/hydrogen antiporter
MTGLLVFAAILMIAVLVSELAHRSVLSTAVLFLVGGFLVGAGVLDIVPIQPHSEIEGRLAELALFSVLFTDGMQAGLRDLRSVWRYPGRALLLGLPLTLLGNAAVAHLVAGLSWTEAFLVGAILAPTDPVFAAAIVGRPEVPYRLRQLLNVESGINDGLALPVVLILLTVAGGSGGQVGTVLGDLAVGVVIGIVVPLVAIRLERLPLFSAATAYEPLNAFAIGLLVLGLASIVHANLFLAAFAAGITVATVSQEVRNAFRRFGELVTELLKLAALFAFGALIAPSLFGSVGVGPYVFAVLALLVVRPAAIGIALLGSKIDRREWIAAAWFGPKGFASVVYGLLLLNSGVPHAEELFDLVALVIVLSILAHSSTDALIARWFQTSEAEGPGPTLTGEVAGG